MDMMMMVGPLFAVIGTIMLALQKKRKLNPIVSAEEAGGHVISGGAIMLCGIGIGTIRLYQESSVAAGLYLLVFLIIYILIHVIFRKK